MPQVFVAAGSNVDPIAHLRQALDELAKIYPSLEISPAYRNKAVGFEGEDFINLVVRFTAEDSIHQVRRNLQEVEKRCGRPADSPKWAPRTIDLDILLYDQLISDEPGLILPRPDLIRRAYMLKPMVDIAPEVMHPTLHKSMRALWESFDRDGHEMRQIELR